MILVGVWHEWTLPVKPHKTHDNQQKNYANLQSIIVIFSSEFFQASLESRNIKCIKRVKRIEKYENLNPGLNNGSIFLLKILPVILQYAICM